MNAADGSCWVGVGGESGGTPRVVHLAATGTLLWASTPDSPPPFAASVNPSDGSCWTADCCSKEAVHLAANGAVLWHGADPPPQFAEPASVSVDQADGSCWVADSGNNCIVHFAPDGTLLWQSAGFPTYYDPFSVSVNPADRSCWVADMDNNQVVHLQPVAPTANFSGSPTSGPVSLGVQFTDTSTGGPTAWSWTFGDGGTSTVQSPSHTYTTSGSYTVSLTASNWGGPNTCTKSGYIAVTPAANFTGSPTSGPVPLGVQFTDTSTGSPTAWSWTFGDGGTSTAENPSHTYTSSNSYTVSLTASSAGGGNTCTKSGYISVTPAANFSGTPALGTPPLGVQFTDSSTGSPTSWSWTFGDTGSSTLQNPGHSYTAVGSYSVALTATNAYGNNTKTRASYVTVESAASGGWLHRNPHLRRCAGGRAVHGWHDRQPDGLVVELRRPGEFDRPESEP